MHSAKLTFDSQSLLVNYLTFKFPAFDDASKINIANYLFQLGFNSYQESGTLAKPIKEVLQKKVKNKFEVYFVVDNPDWGGTLLNFSGRNAGRFYFLWKEKLLHSTLFSSGVLARLDLCYSRTSKPEDPLSIYDFLHQSLQELKQSKQRVSFDKNSKGTILKIGNRASNLCYRIYQEKTSVKFELEMKGRFLQKYHSFLVEDRFQEFEEELSSHFFSYSAKKLLLKYPYLDWLVTQLRPVRVQQVPKNYLNSHYSHQGSFQSFSDRKDFLCLLQFLVYAQTLPFQPDSLGTTQYREVCFRLQDFLTYQNPKQNSNNYHQVKQMLTFFDKLQKNSLIQIFTDSTFRSLMTIPEVKMEKDKSNAWRVKVWIAEELFYYAHRFILPNFGKQKFSKDELEVQFHCLQVFSSNHLEKRFLISEFLESYPAVLSNQRKTKIKQLFLDFVVSLQE